MIRSSGWVYVVDRQGRPIVRHTTGARLRRERGPGGVSRICIAFRGRCVYGPHEDGEAIDLIKADRAAVALVQSVGDQLVGG